MRMRWPTLICSTLFAVPVFAQVFPVKPLKIIVTTSPGGLNDLLSRALGQEVSSQVGQPVVVENRPGAGSMIGMVALARSAPDGYTLAVTTQEPLVYNPFLYTKLPYDPENDFSYVSHLVRNLGAIVAHASAPGSTFPEIIAYAKTNPGKLNWATWGAGSTPALYLDWIRRQNGVDISAIPYKGAGPSVPAIISGQVQLTYSGIGNVLPHIQSGKLKLLAITGASRSAVFPNAPTLGSFNSDPGLAQGFGLYAPAKLPDPIKDRLAAEFVKALRTPALEKVMSGTMELVGSTPSQFAEQIRADRANAAHMFKALGIRPSDAPQ